MQKGRIGRSQIFIFLRNENLYATTHISTFIHSCSCPVWRGASMQQVELSPCDLEIMVQLEESTCCKCKVA